MLYFFFFCITIYPLALNLCDLYSDLLSRPSLRIVRTLSVVSSRLPSCCVEITIAGPVYMKNQISGFPLKGSFSKDSAASSCFSSSSHNFLIVSFLCLHASTPSTTLLSPVSLAPFTNAELRGIRIASYSLKIVSSSSDDGGSAEGLYLTNRRTR